VPALVAIGQLDGYGTGARDEAIVRVAGLGDAGAFRALDVWLAAPFAVLPLGTRTLRAELPGVFLLAAAAGLAFLVIWRSLVAITGPSRWSSVVAAIATAGVSLSYPLQHEATSSGSNLAGLVLILVVLATAREAAPAFQAGLITLALTYEIPVGLCVAVAVLAARLASPRDAASGTRSSGLLLLTVLVGGACGLVPFGLAELRSRVTPLSVSPRALASAFGDGQVLGPRHAGELVRVELGEAVLLLAAVGLGWGLWSRKGRADVVPIVAVGAMATVAFAEVPGGATPGWSATGLVTLVVFTAFAAVAMHEAVLRVARARLPLASASAAMVVVLEAAIPAVQLDDGLARATRRSDHALATWEDAVFAGVRGGALVLVSSPLLYERLLATKASGGFPGDLRMLPAFDPANTASARALAQDSQLVPLFRDLALTGIPQELSLSTLAADRPIVLATDPRWDRSLTRHLVPGALLAVFEPEPRGGADRKRALDDSQAWRTRLSTSLGLDTDAPLAKLTASLLFDRAVAAAQTGEREVALQATQDASTFAPKDARIHELARRQVGARSSVDVRDLARQGLAAP